MSGQATGWVLRNGPRDRAMRYVLLTIADAANRDGEHAHPGLAAICEGSLYSRSRVKEILRRLIDEGWLEVEEEGVGRGNATIYRVPMEKGQPPALSADIKEPATGPFMEEKGPVSDEKRASSDPEKGQFRESAPISATVTTNGKTQQPAVPAGFDAFWSVYPRKEAKLAAQAAWAKATRFATPDEILAGARRYREDPNRVDQFTAHPTTWLNQGRWADAPLPPRNGTRPPPGRGEDGYAAVLDELREEYLGGRT